jgi:cell division septum initiation protein DivIVA
MSLSQSASAQVQAILEAAEASAEQIKREATEEAERIRAAAREHRREDLSGVRELADRLRADLDALTAQLKSLEGGTAPEPKAAETKPVAVAAKAPAKAEPPKPAKPASKPADGDESEGARLIALNMALNGDPREDTDKYLAENFDLADRAALLDEVYASLG